MVRATALLALISLTTSDRPLAAHGFASDSASGARTNTTVPSRLVENDQSSVHALLSGLDERAGTEHQVHALLSDLDERAGKHQVHALLADLADSHRLEAAVHPVLADLADRHGAQQLDSLRRRRLQAGQAGGAWSLDSLEFGQPGPAWSLHRLVAHRRALTEDDGLGLGDDGEDGGYGGEDGGDDAGQGDEDSDEERASHWARHYVSPGMLFDTAGLPLSLVGALVIACCVCHAARRSRDAERRLSRHSEFDKVSRDSSVSRGDSVEIQTPGGTRRLKPGRKKPQRGGGGGTAAEVPDGGGETYFDTLGMVEGGRQEQAILSGLTLTPLQRDTVARAIIRSREGRDEAESVKNLGQFFYTSFLLLSVLVPFFLGAMGIFGADEEEKKHFNRYLRITALVTSIVATALQAFEESGQYRQRGTDMVTACDDMKRLVNNYFQLTGPIFDPRNGSVEELNEGSLQIPDLTGIPIPMLEAHMADLREVEKEDSANETDHGGTNFKRFCMAYDSLKKRLDDSKHINASPSGDSSA